MQNSHRQLYESMGYLLYAVATADRSLHPTEVAEVKKIVTEEWLDWEDSTDPFGSDAAHAIFIVFDYLCTTEIPGEDAFRQFADFVATHPPVLSRPLTEKILRSARKVAHARAGLNKSELTLLARLEKLLIA